MITHTTRISSRISHIYTIAYGSRVEWSGEAFSLLIRKPFPSQIPDSEIAPSFCCCHSYYLVGEGFLNDIIDSKKGDHFDQMAFTIKMMMVISSFFFFFKKYVKKVSSLVYYSGKQTIHVELEHTLLRCCLCDIPKPSLHLAAHFSALGFCHPKSS